MGREIAGRVRQTRAHCRGAHLRIVADAWWGTWFMEIRTTNMIRRFVESALRVQRPVINLIGLASNIIPRQGSLPAGGGG